jgi:hypothetical protein
MPPELGATTEKRGPRLVFPPAIVVNIWIGIGIHPATMIRPLIVAALLALLVTSGLTALARSRDLGALAATATSLWLIASVSYPSIGLVLGPAIALLVGLGLARKGRLWPLGRQITRGMTFVAAVTAIAVAVQAVGSGSAGQAIDDARLDLAGRGAAPSAPPGARDIYVLLLDAYPGSAAVALDPTWDATAFPDALRSRGFDVPAVTHSNYLQTPQTIASVLDMRHLADNPALDAPWLSTADDNYRLRRVINDARGLAELHARGYELVAIASGWAEPELRNVDRYIEPLGLNEFEVGLLRGTGAGDLLTFLAPDAAASFQRTRIRQSFDEIAAEAARLADRPRFVFAHLAAPHPPYVFDAAGADHHDALDDYYADFAPDRGIDRRQVVRMHLEQSTYTAALVIETVDRILAVSPTPPVIVVFSDHGSGTGFDQTRPLESDLVERSSNILAVSSPGQPGLFAAATTPVNILPRLLDAYFDAGIPEQADTLFAWDGSRLNTIAVSTKP